jgi:hypothetical protein
MLVGSLGILLPNLLAVLSGWTRQREVFNASPYAPLRRRSLRRPALLVSVALMIGMLAAAVAGSWRLAVAAIYLLLIPMSALLQRTRGMVALADSVLDERQRQRRDAAHRTAYLILVGAFVVGTVGLGPAQILLRISGLSVPALSRASMMLLVFVVGAEMLYLPALICAWNEPEGDAA